VRQLLSSTFLVPTLERLALGEYLVVMDGAILLVNDFCRAKVRRRRSNVPTFIS
jgi:hypothetical protein